MDVEDADALALSGRSSKRGKAREPSVRPDDENVNRDENGYSASDAAQAAW